MTAPKAPYPKEARIRKGEEIKYVLLNGKTVSARGVRVSAILQRSGGSAFCRLAVIVSKKACRRAVGRNRIRRLVRENFRKWVAPQLMNRKYDVVVRYHRCVDGSNVEERQLLKMLFQKAGLIGENKSCT